MYGSDAGQPAPSLYAKGLLPLCDTQLAVYVPTKKGGETRILNLKRGTPTCIKSTGDKIGITDGWVI